MSTRMKEIYVMLLKDKVYANDCQRFMHNNLRVLERDAGYDECICAVWDHTILV